MQYTNAFIIFLLFILCLFAVSGVAHVFVLCGAYAKKVGFVVVNRLYRASLIGAGPVFFAMYECGTAVVFLIILLKKYELIMSAVTVRLTKEE